MSRRQWRTEDPGVLQSMGSQNQTWLNDWTTTCKTISFTFYFFLSNLDAFIIFFSCIILLARTSSTMLNRCGENRHPYFVSWRRNWQPTPAFLPGKSHGQRYLVGYSPWGCKELDMTEWLHSLSLTPGVVSLHEPLLGKARCPSFVCLISPVGGSSVPCVLPCLMDPRTTIDFSVCSAFYLLLGWSNDLLPIITKEIEKERKESVKCCRVYKANCETVVNPTAIQLQNTIPNISAKMGTIHGRWAQLRTEMVWT